MVPFDKDDKDDYDEDIPTIAEVVVLPLGFTKKKEYVEKEMMLGIEDQEKEREVKARKEKKRKERDSGRVGVKRRESLDNLFNKTSGLFSNALVIDENVGDGDGGGGGGGGALVAVVSICANGGSLGIISKYISTTTICFSLIGEHQQVSNLVNDRRDCSSIPATIDAGVGAGTVVG
ncbi:hypothetical protein M0804_000803 [Polistes exclamans]|nr:hypothetical protein M0804_000803 [Polistes exclamans]